MANMELNVIILAAGQGTRMYSDWPKVLHRIGDKPILEHVIQAAQKLLPKKIHIVYGAQGYLLQEQLPGYPVSWVEQPEPLGTAHAVMQVLPNIASASQVLILYGDVPLLTYNTLQHLVDSMPPDGLSILSAWFDQPTGYGRIIRSKSGELLSVVEERDADLEQKLIREINSGILVTTSAILRNYLPRVDKNNSQREYYLTDIIAKLAEARLPLNSVIAKNYQEVLGVNDKKQLAKLERYYQKSLVDQLMLQGLTLKDPSRVDIRGEIAVGRDITVDINLVAEGRVAIGDNSIIGPNNYIKNSTIGKNVTIKANCVIEDATISDNSIIGPFARIRPKSYLATGVKVGNFVEIKNSQIGSQSKINHLSYIGDSIIGKKVNVGAGTITCNYDGNTKQPTVVKDGVFIGSHCCLIAPVQLGENSYIGAGSVITHDTPPGQLTLARAKQAVIKDWHQKKLT